jgi:beta-phosphoglucomutase
VISLRKPLALIFDMDGVLVDSEPLHKRAKEMAFHEIGIQLPASVYDSYKGRPDATMIHEVLAERGASVDDIADLLHRKHQCFEKIEHELQPIPGAIDFVKWAATHFRLAIATSATPRNRGAALKMLGLENYFDSLVDTARFHHPKPDPEIFRVSMRDLALQPEDCWIIEDSLAGVQAGKASGSFTVAITNTFEPHLLRQAGADLVVDSFAELRSALVPLLRTDLAEL